MGQLMRFWYLFCIMHTQIFAYASSKASDETVQLHSLVRAFNACEPTVGLKEMCKTMTSSPPFQGLLRMLYNVQGLWSLDLHLMKKCAKDIHDLLTSVHGLLKVLSNVQELTSWPPFHCLLRLLKYLLSFDIHFWWVVRFLCKRYGLLTSISWSTEVAEVMCKTKDLLTPLYWST